MWVSDPTSTEIEYHEFIIRHGDMKKTPQPNRFHTLITPYISVIAISKLPPKNIPLRG